MLVFAGLGNPGDKYQNNRHNIGFMVLDRLAQDFQFPPWRQKFQAMITETQISGKKVMLVKPMAFMNCSGQPIGELLRFFKLDSTQLTVFYDEIDLTPGKIRFKAGGGHAGHNGLRSLFQHIGPHFNRIRIGIGHPGDKARVPGWVLADFSTADRVWIALRLQAISENFKHLIKDDSARFVSGAMSDSTPAHPARETLKSPTPKQKKSSELQASKPEKSNLSPLRRLIEKFR